MMVALETGRVLLGLLLLLILFLLLVFYPCPCVLGHELATKAMVMLTFTVIQKDAFDWMGMVVMPKSLVNSKWHLTLLDGRSNIHYVKLTPAVSIST
jgi:hypothetical protein